MWIGQENYDLLVGRVVENLLTPESGMSYTLVVPPGFGESFIPLEIANRLRLAESKPRVAFLNVDSIGSEDEFFKTIEQQWFGISSQSTFHTFGELISKHPKDDLLKVIVISRFHKALDFLDVSVLRELREAEQAAVIKSTIGSIYRLEWIKEQWKAQGHKLVASDYGDSHTKRNCEPIEPREFFRHFSSYRGHSVPADLVRKTLALTGGVPQHFRDVLDLWVDKGAGEVTPKLELEFANLCRENSDQITKHLDDGDQSHYRDLIVDIHIPPKNEEAYFQFKASHPWSNWILDDNGLRSDSLGESCFSKQIKQAIVESNREDPASRQVALAYRAYRRNQFREVITLLKPCVDFFPAGSLRLLNDHAHIMDAMFDRGIDADWKMVSQKVSEAQLRLASYSFSHRDKTRLAKRYSELEAVSKTINSMSTKGSRRIVDLLSDKCEGNAQKNHIAALTILVLQLENSKSSRGSTESINKSISMPEQIFRIWADWAMGLKYNETPLDCLDVWDVASKAWKLIRKSDLRRQESGEQFSGFAVFAFFSVAKMLTRHSDLSEKSPISCFDQMKDAQFIFDWRNDPAHASAVFDLKSRDKFLDLIENWLEILCRSCPSSSIELEEIRSQVAPLPILENEKLVWL